MIRESHFSECGKYRYILKRIWDDEKPVAMCIGLNPSVAGSKKKDGTEKDDPTITRLIATLRALGYGGLLMTNLYAFISSKPAKLFEVPDSIGENDGYLTMAALASQQIIFCWGNFKRIEHRVKKVREMFPSGKCFGKNKNGTPWHPLAMMYEGMKPTEAKLINF